MSKETITMEQVARQKYSERSPCWIVIHNNVYDVTNFLNEVGVLLCVYRQFKCSLQGSSAINADESSNPDVGRSMSTQNLN